MSSTLLEKAIEVLNENNTLLLFEIVEDRTKNLKLQKEFITIPKKVKEFYFFKFVLPELIKKYSSILREIKEISYLIFMNDEIRFDVDLHRDRLNKELSELANFLFRDYSIGKEVNVFTNIYCWGLNIDKPVISVRKNFYEDKDLFIKEEVEKDITSTLKTDSFEIESSIQLIEYLKKAYASAFIRVKLGRIKVTNLERIL